MRHLRFVELPSGDIYLEAQLNSVVEWRIVAFICCFCNSPQVAGSIPAAETFFRASCAVKCVLNQYKAHFLQVHLQVEYMQQPVDTRLLTVSPTARSRAAISN